MKRFFFSSFFAPYSPLPPVFISNSLFLPPPPFQAQPSGSYHIRIIYTDPRPCSLLHLSMDRISMYTSSSPFFLFYMAISAPFNRVFLHMPPSSLPRFWVAVHGFLFHRVGGGFFFQKCTLVLLPSLFLPSQGGRGGAEVVVGVCVCKVLFRDKEIFSPDLLPSWVCSL